MQDKLEQQIRCLIAKFSADVTHIMHRSMQSAFSGVPDLDADSEAHAADGHTRVAGDTGPRRPIKTRRPPPTAEQMAVVRTQVAALIREQPGQSTRELARTIGIPSTNLRPQLRRLADDGLIHIEKHVRHGLTRHTYRPADSRSEYGPEMPPIATGASA
jgi:hypothetical protein